MLTFPQFIDRVDATLNEAFGGAILALSRVEVGGDEVDWERDGNAIRVARQSDAGVVVAPYRAGQRRGPMHVIPMDEFGVHDVCALIIEFVMGRDPTETHF